MRYLTKKQLAIVSAASTDETRYILCSVKLEETEKGLRAIATDGRRLAMIESTTGLTENDFPASDALKNADNTAKEAVIPASAMKQLKKGFKPKSRLEVLNKVAVKMGKEKTTFIHTDLVTENALPVKNIETRYPNYEQIIPKTATFKIAVNPKLLAEMLLLASEITDGTSVTLSFNTAETPIKIEGKDKDHTFVGVVMPMKL